MLFVCVCVCARTREKQIDVDAVVAETPVSEASGLIMFEDVMESRKAWLHSPPFVLKQWF